MNLNSDLISVIVPVYNVEKYLRKCLDSLLSQTYHNLEVILVDDGSEDSSGKICDEYAFGYDNFFVVHKENAGLGMARNTGMEHMTGEYVTFVDSDDWLESELIEGLYKGIIVNNVDVCKGGFRKVKDNGTISKVRKYNDQLFEGKKARLELLPKMIGSSPFQHDSIEMCVWGAIYRVKPIVENGIKFPSERVLISEDIVFNIDYMQYANGACTTSQTGYNYRINEKSLTKSYRKDRHSASVFLYKEINKKLQELEYDNMTLLRLKRIFFVYIQGCIRQETKKISGLSRKENLRNIESICNDKVIRSAIEEYPVKCLGIRQRVFLELIRNRAVYMMYFIASMGIL